MAGFFAVFGSEKRLQSCVEAVTGKYKEAGSRLSYAACVRSCQADLAYAAMSPSTCATSVRY